MTDIITKEMQDAYWDEWQQTQDHWLALAAALKANTPRTERETVEKGCPNDPKSDPENQNIGKDGGQEVEATNPLRYFSENVDRWGAAEWFNRLAMAIREQDKACVAKDDISFETYRMIAASSAMTLVRDHEATVRAALATQPASTALVEAARFLADRLEDFRQKIDDIDDEREFEGHIIPALARLRAAISASRSTSREK